MSLHPQKILCTTDFSEFSTNVMDYGVRLADCFRARLYLFHSVHFPSDTLYGSDFLERVHKQQTLSAQAHEQMLQYLRIAGPNVDGEPVVSCGEPVEQIRRIAEERDVDLVVAASHGLSGFKRILLGTVVERLARTLPRPLLVVGNTDSQGKTGSGSSGTEIRRILIGCNVLADVDPVLHYATEFAGPLNATLHLLHAIEAPMDENLIDPTLGPYSKVQDRLRDRLRHRLDTISDEAGKSRFGMDSTVVAGLPGEALASHAGKMGADLIVVGVQHRSILEKWIIGSTTEAVLRHAPCPVLTVPYRPA